MSRRSGPAAKVEFWPPPPSRPLAHEAIERLARNLLHMHRTHSSHAGSAVDAGGALWQGARRAIQPAEGAMAMHQVTNRLIEVITMRASREPDYRPSLAGAVTLAIAIVVVLAVVMLRLSQIPS